jgi:hypothetical protein
MRGIGVTCCSTALGFGIVECLFAGIAHPGHIIAAAFVMLGGIGMILSDIADEVAKR